MAWLEIPYLFDQAVKAVNFLLEALRPPGEINLPPVALEKSPLGTPLELEPFQIYSRLGETNAELPLGEVARGQPAVQSDHALVIHQMIGPALVDQIKQFDVFSLIDRVTKWVSAKSAQPEDQE